MGDYRGSGPAPTNANRGGFDRPPPEPTGETIARFHRPGLRGAPDTELRVTLDSYLGRPFIGARVWEAGQGGTWWPTKKGVSIKLAEAVKVAADPDAVARVLEHNEQVTRPDDSGGSAAHPRPRPAAPPRQAGPGSPSWEGDGGFDEFAEYRR